MNPSQQTSDVSINSQITRYEEFIDVVLKRDLQRIMNDYEAICEKVVEYTNIKSTIKTMQDNSGGPLKTMSDIGSNCYVKCVVPKSDMIFLDVGLNHFVELTLVEASTFIEKRIEIYTKTLESLVENSSKVKANIKLILNLIDQLRNQAIQ